jgi:hypothetical protein
VKRYLNLAIVAGILAAIGFAYCSGKSSGKATVEDKSLKAEIAAAKAQAKAALETADRLKHRADSLQANLTSADIKVRDNVKAFLRENTKYSALRDSLLGDTTSTDGWDAAIQIALAADSAIAASQVVIKAHEAKDAIQDSVIATQKKIITTLGEVITWRDTEINALNRRLAISVKAQGRSKRQGVMLGIGATAFGIVLVQAAK